MASLALECLYEMAVYRGLIPQLKGGEVALFSLSSAVLTHFHRNKEVQCLVVYRFKIRLQVLILVFIITF